ncbi:molybdopterin converting factor subunit 1 [Undibacterium sp. TJN25]|uniref:molybdopterin converting factor subunit 1 n=1 Tax=Undibacterium sp. TJN25 TaxID=3413056 RepID=UPI003BF1DD4B
MKLELRFFASVREKVGTSAEQASLSAQIKTVGDVRAWLVARGGAWAEALAEGRALRMAYNQEMCSADTPVADGGELAFFPPVTGG